MGTLFVETDDTEVWEEEGIEQDLESTIYEESSRDTNIPLLLWLVHFLALLQKKHFLPDAALVMLLRFLSIFFKVVSRLSPQLITFSEQFPSSLYKFHKLLGTHKETFLRYVTCDKCSMVYKYDDCIDKVGTRVVPKLCSSRFSNRQPACNGTLLRRVELANKSMIYYPFRVYCYMPLFNYLLNRPGFPDLCDEWKKDKDGDGTYKDVLMAKFGSIIQWRALFV